MLSLSSYLKRNRLSLICVGDILAHVEVYKDAKTVSGYDFHRMFSKISPIVKSADLSFCNQESLLGGEELGLIGGKYMPVADTEQPTFCSPYELGDAVVACGFNMIGLANNHMLDKGEDGMVNSLNYWKTKPVITAGCCASLKERTNIPIHEKNGIKFAFLAYTTKTNDRSVPDDKDYMVCTYSDERAKRDIDSIKDLVDLIIVSMHWGTEYNLGDVDDEQDHISKYLANHGVHLIIGHHPHVVEPIKRINNTLVIYSLGNCLACQDGDAITKRIGAMVKLNITKDDKIHIGKPEVELLYCYYNHDHKLFKIIPFSRLTDNELPDKNKLKIEYMNYIL